MISEKHEKRPNSDPAGPWNMMGKRMARPRPKSIQEGYVYFATDTLQGFVLVVRPYTKIRMWRQFFGPVARRRKKFRITARVSPRGDTCNVTVLQKRWTWRAVVVGRPSESDVISRWRSDTSSGRRSSDAWQRSKRDEAYERRVIATRRR